MSIDPIFWLIAAVGFLVLEDDLQHGLRLVRGGQCGGTIVLSVHPVVPGAGRGLCGGQRPLPAGFPAAGGKKLRKKPTPTNGDRGLGREARVLTPVSAAETGRVRLDGVDWNARCATPGDTLAPGDRCRVTEIHSTLLIVEPVLTESSTH